MEVCWRSSWQVLILLGVLIFSTTLQGVQGEFASEGPSESECRPHIEKALKQLESPDNVDSTEDIPTVEITDDSVLTDDDNEYRPITDSSEMLPNPTEESAEEIVNDDDDNDDNEDVDDNGTNNDTSTESEETVDSTESWHAEYVYMPEQIPESNEATDNNLDQEEEQNDEPFLENHAAISEEHNMDETNEEEEAVDQEAGDEILSTSDEKDHSSDADENNIAEEDVEENNQDSKNSKEDEGNSKEDENRSIEDLPSYVEENFMESTEEVQENIVDEEMPEESLVEVEENIVTETVPQEEPIEEVESIADEAVPEEPIGGVKETKEDSTEQQNENSPLDEIETEIEKSGESTDETTKTQWVEVTDSTQATDSPIEPVDSDAVQSDKDDERPSQEDASVVEELIKEDEEEAVELRPRDHVAQLLKLDTESEEFEKVSEKTSDILLRDLKKLYENAIRPLETLYKYRDLSNRHFGDSEIFSKPLILFMGPWSGGKSSIINYLLDIEYKEINLHTGAEPSPAYFNILMHGDEPEILDGTELAADYTFSGLQKFGQGLEERLKGYKFPSKLLEKVNIVEIPGILEVRKQVSRIFPFNDACQWFIDRADIIFLVYDPSKLDVGPETEAILDQLKGREHQTRILLNKADQVKPEELMRVQGALIWNISPLMSSAQPPVMYTTSLWSQPYEQWAPVRLLQAQERAFLRDLRSAIDKRIDNKIASARRFAVRVRNHAKMVDCYLTTYYNHKSVFGNRKQVSDEIINHPQDYHIYEGLSTLTNISRYDLPDPDVYRDFFRLNALYDFQQLSSTCTYFRGCPINRLDVAIAYDLPELVGKHKRLIETAANEAAAAATKTPSS